MRPPSSPGSKRPNPAEIRLVALGSPYPKAAVHVWPLLAGRRRSGSDAVGLETTQKRNPTYSNSRREAAAWS
jgi:hypothetical protein